MSIVKTTGLFFKKGIIKKINGLSLKLIMLMNYHGWCLLREEVLSSTDIKLLIEELGVSKISITRALKELVELGMLSSSEPGHYKININLMHTFR